MGNDTIDWAQFGVPSTVNNSPVAFVTTGGFTGTVISGSGVVQARRQSNVGCSNYSSTLWCGSFNPGDSLIYPGAGVTIDLHLNNPISAGGAQIQAGTPGGLPAVTFTGCAYAVTPSGNSNPFCVSGLTSTGSDNSAPYLGVNDLTGANITDLVFSLSLDPHNAGFALNQVSLAVPEPGTGLLVAGTLAVLGLAGWRRTRA